MLRRRCVRTAAIGILVSLAAVGTAMADGPPTTVTRLIHGFGGTTDTGPTSSPPHDHGSIGLAGQLTYSPSGDLTAVDIVLAYQDSKNDADAITCTFQSPNDVSFAAGVLTLTVGANDACFRTTDGNKTPIPGDASAFISFYVFGPSDGEQNFVGKSCSLRDAGGEEIVDQTVVGTIQTVLSKQGHGEHP